MSAGNKQLQDLTDIVNKLSREQELLRQQLFQVKQQLQHLQHLENQQITPIEPASIVTTATNLPALPQPELAAAPAAPAPAKPIVTGYDAAKPPAKNDIEQFIGTNLISKLGILILVIGVGIGTKYAIDKELLSPLTRIVLGYLLGGGLSFTAFRLKNKYPLFSALLVSGSMAVFYITTYAAYSFFGLLSQPVAFGVLCLVTIATVLLSLHYNLEWIALFAMAGGYAIPFLVSTNQSNPKVLFAYMALLNAGILTVSVLRYWRLLYVVSAGITWSIMGFFSFFDDQSDRFTSTTIGFSTLFYLLFMAVFLTYKIRLKKAFEELDVVLIILNSFVFFIIGLYNLHANPAYTTYDGAFTLGIALLNVLAALLVWRIGHPEKALQNLFTGLFLVFLAIAIPIQLHENWIAVAWLGQAAVLYFTGRKNQTNFYEVFSYPLMMLGLLWNLYYLNVPPPLPLNGQELNTLIPLANPDFLISLLSIAAYAFIAFTSRRYIRNFVAQRFDTTTQYSWFFGNILPFLGLILLLYFTGLSQLIIHWQNQYGYKTNLMPPVSISFDRHYDSVEVFRNLKGVWIFNYTLLFFSIILIANLQFVKQKLITNLGAGLLIAVMLLTAIQGMGWHMELQHSLSETKHLYKVPGWAIGVLRVTTYALLALAILVLYRVQQTHYKGQHKAVKLFDWLLHGLIVVVISHELIMQLSGAGMTSFNKLGLSICWGIYALALVVMGFLRLKKHLRVAGIALFGITLVKLFGYDLQHLSTMSKTIVFLALGVLLLLASYGYNRFQKKLEADEATG